MKISVIALVLATVLLYLFPQQVNADICGVFERRVNDSCVKFTVPSNAHLTYSGNSWDCNRGYKMSADKDKCEEIKVPGNATANTIGSFFCNSGFKRVGNECEKVTPIENGKFYEFGANFSCNKGYKRNEETKTCDKIKIPDNAFEDSTSLDGWNCSAGFLKEGSECKKFDLPEHAFWFNNNWGCEPGYKKIYDRKVCEPIKIPQNAHPSNTYDGWLCNSGYTKNYKDNRCDKPTP